MKSERLATTAEQGTGASAGATNAHAHEWHAKAIGQKGIICTVADCHAELGEHDNAPAEARAEERGHVDPQPAMVRDPSGRVTGQTRHALTEYRAFIYEAAKVQWGTWDEHGNGTPGGAGKELTGPEYDAFVTKAMGVTAR